MANYKKATRENWTFNTNVGVLNVQQLFTASDATLIQLEEDLKEEAKAAKKPNRFQKTASKDKLPKLKLELVTDVIDTIIEEREESQNAAANKEHNQKILALIKRKQDADLENLSIEELEKMIK
jgi:hypothetical protein